MSHVTLDTASKGESRYISSSRAIVCVIQLRDIPCHVTYTHASRHTQVCVPCRKGRSHVTRRMSHATPNASLRGEPHYVASSRAITFAIQSKKLHDINRNESCHTYTLAMSRRGMSHVTHRYASCHTQE